MHQREVNTGAFDDFAAFEYAAQAFAVQGVFKWADPSRVYATRRRGLDSPAVHGQAAAEHDLGPRAVEPLDLSLHRDAGQCRLLPAGNAGRERIFDRVKALIDRNATASPVTLRPHDRYGRF